MSLKIRGAVLKKGAVKQVSEKFSVQNLYLDTSTFNSMTGERYDGLNMFQNINGKIDLSPFKIGDVVDVEFYLNGRTFERKNDGSIGFMQQANIKSVEKARNTAGDAIVFPEEQLLQTELPE